MKPIFKSSLFALVIIFPWSVQAQVGIKLQAAIDSVIKNNLTLKNEHLKTEYQKLYIKTAIAIPQTNLGIEYGQLNSWYSDTRFGIGQNINFPTVYTKQKSVLTETWKNSLLQLNLKEKDLVKEVSTIYYTLYFLFEKEKLLMRSDSIYQEFLSKSILNFKTGESNLLEKITAETQQGMVTNQLNEIRADIKIIQCQFQYLLNSKTFFKPSEPIFKLTYNTSIDTAQLSKHPSIEILKQQTKIAEQNTALERSKLMPNLGVSYSNMSMKGEGADRQSYTTSTRFQSFQFGIGIPLFYGAQKASINASKINETIASSNYFNGIQLIKIEFEKALLQFNKSSQLVTYYETIALNNAKTIISSSKIQFSNGEINYLDFVMLTNQAISIQNEYINAVKNLNESILYLRYLEQGQKLQ
ncbi:MAG: TolC family protein [bacterium]|nr:TolC family protein [bacterium]